MLLVDWEQLIASMLVARADRPKTLQEAKLRGFDDTYAQVAAIFVGAREDELREQLEPLSVNDACPPFLQAVICMRLAEMETRDQFAKDWRDSALKAAKNTEFNPDRGMLLAWIENTRFTLGDEEVDWRRYQTNLDWLLNGQRDATKLTLYLVREQAKVDKFCTAQRYLSTLAVRMARNEVTYTNEDVSEANRLKDLMRRRRAEIRARNSL